MKYVFFLLIALLVPSLAAGEIRTGTVEYKDRDTVFEGYSAQPEGITEKSPAVLVIHDWMGLNDHYKNIANNLASMGYVAFAADIYGKGIRPANTQEAAAQANKYKSDRKLLRERVHAGLEQLLKNKDVDPNRVAAIGYCFGGTTVLELARSGAPIAGVVSFHGGLDSPTPEDGKNIKAKVLVLHGADDPFVPPKDVAAFQDELRKGTVDWQMIYYGGQVHAFTTPYAGNDKSKGVAYDEKTAKRSWEAMKLFFNEIFGASTKK
jgi:dienelactone hydrolase